MSNTPVLFLVFNRPDTTARVFEAIRQVKPKELFIAADGPRKDRPDDLLKCNQVQEIVRQVDWDCNVKTLFRETNLGCKHAVSSAIDWFFEQVEEGIILEDDCLPDLSFFNFCSVLLEHYRNERKVMHIGGANFQLGQQRGKASYYPSRYSHVWGWATWRRAWQHYDVNLNAFEADAVLKCLPSILEKQYWFRIYEEIKNGTINTWDYQWTLTIWQQKGMCIIPNGNLVKNIGFGPESTHTSNSNSSLANISTEAIHQVIHPATLTQNVQADRFTYRKFINPPPTTLNRVKNIAYSTLSQDWLKKVKKLRQSLLLTHTNL